VPYSGPPLMHVDCVSFRRVLAVIMSPCDEFLAALPGLCHCVLALPCGGVQG